MMDIKKDYKMTDLGEIPDNWVIKEIGEIFKTIPNMSLSRNQTVNTGDSYYLHYGDIHKNNLSQFDTKRDMSWLPMINKSEVKVKEDAKLFTGDVVFADASEDLKDIGKNIVVVNEDNSEFYAGLHTIPIRESEEKNILDTVFKGYCFKVEQVKKQIKRLANGTTVLGISKPNLLSVKFAVPPLKEQQKIAEILSAVDEQIEQTDQLIEKTKELKKGLMQQLLTKGIGHTEFKQTELGEIPFEWEVKELKKVLEKVVGGGTPSRKNSEFYVGNIPWITVKDMKGDFYQGHSQESINEDAIKKSATNLIEPGNVVISTRMALGKGFINTQRIAINQDLKALYLNQYKVYNPYFLYWYVSNAKQIESLGSGTTVKGIRLEQLSKLKMPLPPTEEQKKIAEILSYVDEDIDGYEEEKVKYEELKKSLMQQLLTGKTRVKVD